MMRGMKPTLTALLRGLPLWLPLFLALCFPTRAAAAEAPWAVAGQQGLLKVVIVPTAQATDMAAYKGQIASLCPGDRTCFVNFFTNSTGAPVALPLPDAIADEATARFRRSTKNGADLFQWSCRLKLGGECF